MGKVPKITPLYALTHDSQFLVIPNLLWGAKCIDGHWTIIETVGCSIVRYFEVSLFYV